MLLCVKLMRKLCFPAIAKGKFDELKTKLARDI